MAQPVTKQALLSPLPRFTFLTTCSRRSFSSSSTLLSSKIVPTFRPTSSPELDELFDRFRTRLFIPKSLSSRYEKLIFNHTKAEELRKFPVVVSISTGESEQDYTLEPLSQADLPTRGDLEGILRRLETREDWQNVTTLLGGMVAAGRNLRPTDLERIIRKAGMAGRTDIALEIAKQASRTGATLDDPGRARALFLACRQHAQYGEFEGEALSSALVFAKQASLLMDDPVHVPAEGSADPRRSPELAGILLELSAQQAISANGGADTVGDVQMYSRVVLANWEFGDFSVPSAWELANQKLLDLVPLWHGMSLARKVKEVKADSGLYKDLAAKMGSLEAGIERAMKTVENEGQKRPLIGYNLAKSLYAK